MSPNDINSIINIIDFLVLTIDTGGMKQDEKRTIQVNVRMGEQDLQLLHQAADKIWPDAILSNAGILLGLARMAAKDILAKGAKRTR